MHKSAILLFGLTIGLISPPASTQAPVEKIAYDTCYLVFGEGYYSCYIQVANVDGTGAIRMPMEAYDPAWSPDGTRIAFAEIWGTNVYVWSGEDGSIVGLPNSSLAGSPTWAPDGEHIAFASYQSGSSELYMWESTGTVTQLTDQAGFIGSPAWSPDGTRIAFDCEIDPANRDICALELATGAIARLTTELAFDTEPAWSPDGTRLAFSTTRFGAVGEIAIMNADGSEVSRLGLGIAGQQPAWSPDGNWLAFVTTGGPCDELGYCLGVINLVNIDGTGQTFFGYGLSATWAASTAVFGWPNASASDYCVRRTCSFSGTGSWDDDGQITGYSWDFGDGGSGAGANVNHTYLVAGTYSVTLTVVDNDGLEVSTTISAHVLDPPVAVAAVSCSGLTCSFDGSGSSDADGTIVNYRWNFGGVLASGPIVSHTYATGGSHSVWLRVTDNAGETSETHFFVPVIAPVHVGDLDGLSTSSKDKWTARVTITAHTDSHPSIGFITVNGTWSTGTTGTCTTNAFGQCTIFSAPIKNSIANATFTVGSIVDPSVVYVPAANHDPDGDSNGTRITVVKKR